MWITIPKRVVMKDPKKDNIHHFADEFAFEDLKRESGVRVHITPSSILLKMASFQ
jgi:hypothetical protein